MQSRSYPDSYKNTQHVKGNARENEARALTEAARRLNDGLTKKNYRLVYDGLQFNLRLWTIFQTDIATDENPMPMDLKKTILELCKYIDKSTFKYYETRDESILQSFIDINRTIAGGMMEKPPQPAQQTKNAAPTEGQAAIQMNV
jgi:flagellar biosynthesis activator protein FlaF